MVHESANHLFSFAWGSNGGARLVNLIFIATIHFILRWTMHRIRLRLQKICWVARNSDLGDRFSKTLRPREFSLHYLLVSSFSTFSNVKGLASSLVRVRSHWVRLISVIGSLHYDFLSVFHFEWVLFAATFFLGYSWGFVRLIDLALSRSGILSWERTG